MLRGQKTPEAASLCCEQQPESGESRHPVAAVFRGLGTLAVRRLGAHVDVRAFSQGCRGGGNWCWGWDGLGPGVRLGLRTRLPFDPETSRSLSFPGQVKNVPEPMSGRPECKASNPEVGADHPLANGCGLQAPTSFKIEDLWYQVLVSLGTFPKASCERTEVFIDISPEMGKSVLQLQRATSFRV